MAAVAKDPAIKLFGRTISLPEPQFSDDSESLDNGSSLVTKAETEECRIENSTIDENASFEPCKGEQSQISMQQAISSQETSKSKAHQEESDGTEDPKLCKRPDKILPCPRCNSSDTKFCYFNNYNVNQPRHFCKSCQRYWTAGGTVRSVPVGAGRRRNKHLASQYRQIITSSDGGPTTVVETPDSTNQLISCEESASSCTASSPNEMVLKFGPESPHCNSMPNLLRQRNGCSEMSLRNCELYENRSLPCGSPSTASSIGVRGVNNDVSLQQPLYHCTVPPQIAALVPNSNNSAPLPVPGYGAPNISYQFVPASYWNCIPVWVAGSGNVPLAVSNGCVSPPFFSSGNGDNGLQVLGKHSRDTNPADDEIIGMGISPSKTLKIHDLNEA